MVAPAPAPAPVAVAVVVVVVAVAVHDDAAVLRSGDTGDVDVGDVAPDVAVVE